MTLNGLVGTKAHGLRAGMRVGDNIDHGWFTGTHRGLGTFQSWANPVRFFYVLTVATQNFGEFIIAGKPQVATGHFTNRGPAAIVAHHDQDRDACAGQQCPSPFHSNQRTRHH